MRNLGQLRSFALRAVTRGLLLASALAIPFGLMILPSSPAQAQTFSVIYAFTGGIDGCTPWAGVTIRAGSLYGTTRNCGNEFGTVYELTPQGNNWSETTLAAFYYPGNPEARVLFGPDGHLYGTTSGGIYGTLGNVFELIPPLKVCKTAACPNYWTINVIYSFTGIPGDDRNPGQGDLIWDQQGNIYGTTAGGLKSGYGTVYELMPPVPPGNTWTESVLHSFGVGNDGIAPQNGVILDSNGDLFGTTEYGGLINNGIIFELAQVNDNRIETILCNFGSVGCRGTEPVAGLISDSSGNLYGATTNSGSGGGGLVFELSPSGDSWTYTALYSFPNTFLSECGPWGDLTLDAAGNLYGTTYCGGANQLGNVWRLANTQNGWVYTPLHDFTGGSDGANPIGKVIMDANGHLYGTAAYGGSNNCVEGCGTVWMITP